jgi:hypothetical protein
MAGGEVHRHLIFLGWFSSVHQIEASHVHCITACAKKRAKEEIT